ncbi:MAG: asparagine synthetase B [Chitinophagales bacterium]|nr:asparagine synthetase B [Chitinophagales bacterium]
MKKIYTVLILFFVFFQAHASYLLVPMDETQKDHLKAYGLTYWVIAQGAKADWMLNYRGGSFCFPYQQAFENECLIRGISYEVIPDAQYNKIVADIANPEVNMDVMKLETPPKVAVYSPKSKQPWDDAVTLVLTYAEIPYTVIYDEDVMNGDLPKYDWLHLHHEDFTGQYGKFYSAYRNQAWYQEQVSENEEIAAKFGFTKVSQLKLAVTLKIKEFVAGGGYLFAMCSATDSYDIALAAEGIDICESMYDGDAADPQAQQKLDFSKTFAFENFNISRNPLEYSLSTIDVSHSRNVPKDLDFFTLFEFSAKWDPVPTMLTQDHEQTIPGFFGQTTGYKKELIKSGVLIMGENKPANEARYIHGEFGYGTWTFYGGHDPADYKHYVGDPPTELELHPNSAGYRLILNNVLFPAAKKKKQKT